LNGTIVQAERFLVGPIAHILKNRFYIGEVVYRGETNMGEHDPIVDREVFEAVQQRLAASAVSRKHKNTRSSSYLVGLLFDDRGHAMSPSHANKKGIRYRYYVSQAVLQNRKSEAGSVARVSAPEVERIVTQALRDAFQGGEESSDVELIARHLRRVTIHSSKVTVVLLDESVEDGISATTTAGGPRVLELPFTPTLPIRKGIARTPAPNGTIDPRERDALLLAIARARDWMDAIISGRSSSFEEIASKEGLGVRHVRRLAPLAFLSPRVAQAIAEGSASSALTVSFLTPALPHSWLAQEEMVGLR
jgi:site-specific DNA recombinase